MKKNLLFKNLIAFFLLWCFTSLTAQIFLDFEGVTKEDYTTGIVTIGDYDWKLTEALIGISQNDWKEGDKSVRLKGAHDSELVLETQKNDGIGQISFKYRRYGTDSQVDWKVEYTLDNGSTWMQVGTDFTAPDTDDVQTFSANVNVIGSAQIRIIRATVDTNTANKRLNIDNLSISNWPASLSDFTIVNGTTFNPGDILNFTWTAIGVSEVLFEVKFSDSDWEFIEDFGIIDATLDAFQLPIPLNAGDAAIKIRIVDNFNNSAVSNEVEIIIVDNIFGGIDPEEGHYPEAGETNVAIDLYVLKTGMDEHGDSWAWSSRGEIIINFDEDEIVANTGNITISKQGEAEPIYTFNVATSENIEVDRNTVRIILPENLSPHTTYEVVVPAGAFADIAATPNFSDLISWSFTTGIRAGSDVFAGLNPQNGLFPAKDAVDVFTNLYFHRSGVDENDNPWKDESVREIKLNFIDQIARNVGLISISKQGESTPVFIFDVANEEEVWVHDYSVRIPLPDNYFLDPNAIYEVVIPSGAIVDLTTPTANQWEGITWSFTTSESFGGSTLFSGLNPVDGLFPAENAVGVFTNLYFYRSGTNWDNTPWEREEVRTIILEFIDDVNLNIGTITILKGADPTPIYTFDVAVDNNIRADWRSVRITLPENLDPNTTYQVVVPPGAIVDRSDFINEWEGITWSFTTGTENGSGVFSGGLDPQDGLYPAADAVNVFTNLYIHRTEGEGENSYDWEAVRTIILNFTNYVNLNVGTIAILKEGDSTPIYTFDVDAYQNVYPYGRLIRIVLPENLDPNTTYQVVVPAGAVVDGHLIDNEWEGVTWSFTTGSEKGGPQFSGLNPVNGLFPAENEEDVSTNLYVYKPGQGHITNTIILEFADYIDLNVGTITIFKEGDSTPIYTFDVTTYQNVYQYDRSVRIYLPENLDPNTTYQVVVPSGAVVDRSLNTNEWEGITWSFTTGGGEGSGPFTGLAPENGLYPAENAVDVFTDLYLDRWSRESERTIILEFADYVNLNVGTITLSKQADSTPLYTFDVATAENIYVDGYTVEINLSENLLPNTTYEVVIPQGAIVDRSPTTNEWEGKAWTFTTGDSDSFKSIYEIRDQKNEPAFMGEYVRTSGIVTKKLSSGTLFLQDDDSRGWSGIFVNDTDFGSIANEGDEFILVGKVGFTDGMAQLSDIVHSNLKTTNQSFTPKLITLPFTEEYESMLVKIENVSVEGNPVLNQEFWVSDGEKTGLISKLWYAHPAEKNQSFSSITGILHSDSEHYKLAPRNANDLVSIIVSSHPGRSAKILVSPNPVSDILYVSAPSEIEFIEMVSIVGGRVVKESGSNRSSISISTAGLSQGVYVMKIVLENGETLVMKIFKK